MNRSGYYEETYFSWSIIPMVGGDGSVMGLYNPAFEKTRRKIAERRMLTLREVGERTAPARDVKAFWEAVYAALKTNDLDAPYVLLYSVSDESDSDSSSIHSSSLLGSKQCYLEGALGVTSEHPSAPLQIDLKSGNEGFGPVFREVMKTDKPVYLEVGTGELPASMMEGVQWGGFGDPCRAVVVCPVHPTTGESVLGFLVIGVNPRRPYDDDYSLFVQLLSRQLATSLASVVLFEEEIRRGQKAARLAALDRIELSEQLAARTQEAKENETRFTRMAEFSPAGLFIADSEGHITYCNDTWFEITRVPKDEYSTDRWIDSVHWDDQPKVKRLWSELVNNTQAVTAEFRLRTPWEDRNGNRSDTWVLFSAYPEIYEQGILKSVFGCLTNISQQKWAEGFQKRKMEEAVELKRQQENFIDITSHEMRNPLSAILQCADEIATSLSEFRNSGQDKIDDELVNNSIDAAQTIGLCALHQKRIVDDILTLSKLDSAMLHVTPVDVQPLSVVQRALKMFENEVSTAKIKLDFVIDPSYQTEGINWVKADPSRVLQVLINLTGNAIKFTTTEERKQIQVSISASKQKPSSIPEAPVSYFPSRTKRSDQVSGPDWGDGEVVYLQFAVQDTGRGLTQAEKKLLFMRFSQASPRTHVQYGGSGLGLFISRELTELQGGEIGVASEAGKGSTFAFYIKCRKTAPPPEIELVPSSSTSLPNQMAQKAAKSAEGTLPQRVKSRDFAEIGDIEKAKPRDRSHLSILIVEDNLGMSFLSLIVKPLLYMFSFYNFISFFILFKRWKRTGEGEDGFPRNIVLLTNLSTSEPKSSSETAQAHRFRDFGC
jgi:PAS domain S-box-containing protein